MAKHLNADLLTMIVPFLSPSEISTVMLTCKEMQAFALPYLFDQIQFSAPYFAQTRPRSVFNRERVLSFLSLLTTSPQRVQLRSHIRALAWNVGTVGFAEDVVHLPNAFLSTVLANVLLESPLTSLTKLVLTDLCFMSYTRRLGSAISQSSPSLRELEILNVSEFQNIVDLISDICCPLISLRIRTRRRALQHTYIADDRHPLHFANTLQKLHLHGCSVISFGDTTFSSLRQVTVIETELPWSGLSTCMPALQELYYLPARRLSTAGLQRWSQIESQEVHSGTAQLGVLFTNNIKLLTAQILPFAMHHINLMTVGWPISRPAYDLKLIVALRYFRPAVLSLRVFSSMAEIYLSWLMDGLGAIQPHLVCLQLQIYRARGTHRKIHSTTILVSYPFFSS
jgi:hypothetical protein